uniref:Ycf13 n=1 Tax=Phacus orbicularis TaxID=158829 RepID=A0A182B0W6_9EUGL|nr:ycf13 [Phacus orbicularis]
MLFSLLNLNNAELISWKKTIDNLYRLQRRIFKSAMVRDLKKCSFFQNLLVKSNVARLVAIRYISNLQVYPKVYSYFRSQGNKDFSLNNKITLLNLLSTSFYTWTPSQKESYFIYNEFGKLKKVIIFTIEDRCWQILVKLLMEPTYEAILEPQILGFRYETSVHFIQKILLLNLSKNSYGFQKRILQIEVKTPFEVLSFEPFLVKLFLNKKIKIIIYRFLKLGLQLDFNQHNCQMNQLVNLLANIFLSGFKSSVNWIRFGSKLLFFLGPLENEITTLSLCESFFKSLGLKTFENNFLMVSLFQGFDFLGWNFKCSNLGNLLCIPSLFCYKKFLFRVKSIVNNSNYGALIKALKLFPLIKKWKFYYKFCNSKNFTTSLLYFQKRAFRVLKKEVQQDRYSTKNLLEKSFFAPGFNFNKKKDLKILFSSHFRFCCNSNHFFENHFFCIHCGLEIT